MIYRLIVTDLDGAVLLTEFHDTAAAAQQRAAAHERQGRRTSVTQGAMAEDGTFEPTEG